MAITPKQELNALKEQWEAANEQARFALLVAGPGTGKTNTITHRVFVALSNETETSKIYVVTFTNAACKELKDRIFKNCSGYFEDPTISALKVSTLHSLGLKTLRRAGQLIEYPGEPIVADEWEQKNIFDGEVAARMGMGGTTRVKHIRKAYDAMWQTNISDTPDEYEITEDEKERFVRIHDYLSRFYSFVLPGEIIYRCVDAYNNGRIPAARLPVIEDLIVDEFQDLNKCDHDFIRILSAHGAKLFVAGDDDQSIYGFRYAYPRGIIHFQDTYQGGEIKELTSCFRCTPNILVPALNLIVNNSDRYDKNIRSLYTDAEPPVPGYIHTWFFSSPTREYAAIARSCKRLIECGMEGRENEILILITKKKNRTIQLNFLERHLELEEVPYDRPTVIDYTDDFGIRAIYALLRIIKSYEKEKHDYLAHRTLLQLLSGVGIKTIINIGNKCAENVFDFINLFYNPEPPAWLDTVATKAISRAKSILDYISTWSMEDPLFERAEDIHAFLTELLFTRIRRTYDPVEKWGSLYSGFPEAMTLGDLLDFFTADTESDQLAILEAVSSRLVLPEPPVSDNNIKKVKIMTMHGAKGLSGSVVFIPSVEEGLIPSFRSLSSPVELEEQRRLFYVSLTRARAACILSHCFRHCGGAKAITGDASCTEVRLERSRFLNEAGLESERRTSGLSTFEAERLIESINYLF
ncbi:MAG TPA: ATP-dependent helicase [bacterium]|nr:ATP-dependent helicase [bacterium]